MKHIVERSNRQGSIAADMRYAKAQQIGRRRHDLRLWDRAVGRAVRFDLESVGSFANPDLPTLLARVKVELAQLDETLGVFDAERIYDLAEVFDLPLDRAADVWGDAVAEAEANDRAMRRHAERRLNETRVATLEHRTLVTGRELSAALCLTFERKQMIFKRPRVWEDGRVVFLPPIETRLPTWVPSIPMDADREVVSVSSTSWELPLAERRHLRDRLGYEIDTISKKHRALSEAEFRAWASKREAKTWSADRLAGRKLPGESDFHATQRLLKEDPKTRTRKPGVTAARRAYAKAIGRCLRTARTHTKDMTAEAIYALVDAKNVTHLPRYGGNACPDKNDGNPPFSVISTGIMPTEGMKAKLSKDSTTDDLDDRDRFILFEWYLAKKGKILKAGTVRQWRHRQTLDQKLFEACEFVLDNVESWPKVSCLHADMRVQEYQAKRTKTDRDRKLSKSLSPNIVEVRRAG